MPLSLQKSREIAFQLLYSRSFKGGDEDVPLVMKVNSVSKKGVLLAKEKVDLVWNLSNQLDLIIANQCEEEGFSKVPQVQKTILRLALFELLHTDLPEKVIIAEAVRLTRKYNTREGGSFVNAILDAFYKRGEHTDFRKRQVTQ